MKRQIRRGFRLQHCTASLRALQTRLNVKSVRVAYHFEPTFRFTTLLHCGSTKRLSRSLTFILESVIYYETILSGEVARTSAGNFDLIFSHCPSLRRMLVHFSRAHVQQHLKGDPIPWSVAWYLHLAKKWGGGTKSGTD
jgi:hypothetical protein